LSGLVVLVIEATHRHVGRIGMNDAGDSLERVVSGPLDGILSRRRSCGEQKVDRFGRPLPTTSTTNQTGVGPGCFG